MENKKIILSGIQPTGTFTLGNYLGAVKIIREKILGQRLHPARKVDRYESYYAQPTFVSGDRYYLHADVNAYA